MEQRNWARGRPGPEPVGDLPFGPNSSAVDAMLERAGRLTEAEGEQILALHFDQRARDVEFRNAIESVVFAAYGSHRDRAMGVAEARGRAIVSVFQGTARGTALAGYVGRLAEACVVADRVDETTLEPLTLPWTLVIGPLLGRRPPSPRSRGAERRARRTDGSA